MKTQLVNLLFGIIKKIDRKYNDMIKIMRIVFPVIKIYIHLICLSNFEHILEYQFFSRAHGSNNKTSKLWRCLNCNILLFRKLYIFSQKKWLNLWTHLWSKYIVIIKWSLFKLITQFTRYIGAAVHISILDTNLEFNLFYHFATLIKLLLICLLL